MIAAASTCTVVRDGNPGFGHSLAALESVVRCHHVFKQVWTPIQGLRLTTSVVDTKKYAPNSEYALNNEVHLTTGVYGMYEGDCPHAVSDHTPMLQIMLANVYLWLVWEEMVS